MSGRYILNAAGDAEPCADLLRWALWFETADRVVAQETIEDALVSTVFLGIDHAFLGGPPVLWETMVFGGPLSGEQDRYHTRAEALSGHDVMVGRVRHAVWTAAGES